MNDAQKRLEEAGRDLSEREKTGIQLLVVAGIVTLLTLGIFLASVGTDDTFVWHRPLILIATLVAVGLFCLRTKPRQGS